jgi:hypothetical protein
VPMSGVGAFSQLIMVISTLGVVSASQNTVDTSYRKGCSALEA